MGAAGYGNEHEPFDIKALKGLKDAVTAYGPNAPFTLALLENIGAVPLTPADWTQLARACLSPGQFTDWKAWNTEFCTDRAEQNLTGGHRGWNLDMLLGQGQHANDQLQYPRAVYDQITQCAIRAWKQLTDRGKHSSCLTKVVQGITEPFADFVARVEEAASKVFPDLQVAAPLLKQLIFEQCTRDCRAAITPHKNKSLETWTKLCREIGGPLSNSGIAALVAAAMQQTGQNTKNQQKGCFKCGEMGHIRRFCPSKEQRGSLGPRLQGGALDLCKRCRKGPHAAEDCRSIFDREGNRLTGTQNTNPKNGQRGSAPGTDPRPRNNPFVDQGAWTSVPPPNSY